MTRQAQARLLVPGLSKLQHTKARVAGLCAAHSHLPLFKSFAREHAAAALAGAAGRLAEHRALVAHHLQENSAGDSLRSWNPGMSARLLVGCMTSSIVYSVVWHTRVGAVSGAELPNGMPSTCVCIAYQFAMIAPQRHVKTIAACVQDQGA